MSDVPLSTDTKVDPAFKAKWLEALRSGRYRQGRCYLRTGAGKFCCMGVALDLKDASNWGDPDPVGDQQMNWGDLQSVMADEKLAFELGISEDDVRELARLNDERPTQKGFNEIADWIEANL